MERFSPTHAVISSGKAIAYAAIYRTMMLKGVNTVTWDLSPAFPDGITINRNCYAPEVHLSEQWAEVADTPLTGEQEGHLENHFARWRLNKNTRWQYHADSEPDSQELSRFPQRLNL